MPEPGKWNKDANYPESSTQISLALATPSQAAAPSCTISFTPDTIGPGQVTQGAITVNGALEEYHGVVVVNGVAGPSVPVGTTNSGPIPYEALAPSVTGSDPVVLDYQIYWKRARPPGPRPGAAVPRGADPGASDDHAPAAAHHAYDADDRRQAEPGGPEVAPALGGLGPDPGILDGSVALIDAGTCKITVRGHGHGHGHGDVVRRAQVEP
jgi:hypothetical protein